MIPMVWPDGSVTVLDYAKTRRRCSDCRVGHRNHALLMLRQFGFNDRTPYESPQGMLEVKVFHEGYEPWSMFLCRDHGSLYGYVKTAEDYWDEYRSVLHSRNTESGGHDAGNHER